MAVRVRKTFEGYTIKPGFPIGRTLFGLPFLLMGLTFMYLSATGEMKTETGEPAGLAGVAFSSIFALVGFCVMAGRKGYRVDERGRKFVSWWGVLFPFRSTEYDLDNCKEVTLTKEVRRSSNSNGGSSSKTVYPVKLVHDDGVKELSAWQDAIGSRLLAEAICRGCDLPMVNYVDSTGGSRREPHQLDWSLREHLLDAGDAPPEPDRPAGTAIDVEHEGGDAVTLRLPPMGVMKSGAVLFLPAIPFVAIPLFFFMRGDSAPPLFFILFALGIFVVPILVMLMWFVTRGLTRTTLRLTPDEITVAKAAPWWRSTKTLPAEKVEELSVKWDGSESPLASLIAHGGLTLITDDGHSAFGEGLSGDDTRYVADMIRHVVCR